VYSTPNCRSLPTFLKGLYSYVTSIVVGLRFLSLRARVWKENRKSTQAVNTTPHQLRRIHFGTAYCKTLPPKRIRKRSMGYGMWSGYILFIFILTWPHYWPDCAPFFLQVLFMLKPLQTSLPIARAAQISLVKPPDVDFSLTLTKGIIFNLHFVSLGPDRQLSSQSLMAYSI